MHKWCRDHAESNACDQRQPHVCAYIMLKHNHEPITCHSVQYLQNATNSQDIRQYYQAKYPWNDNVVEDIDWTVHGIAMQNLLPNDTHYKEIHSQLAPGP